MRILLDTHVLIWALSEPQRLSKKTREIITDSRNVVLFSAASIWEIAIKGQLGRARFSIDSEQVAAEAVAAGFEELPIKSVAASRVAHLPPYHRDPFDRILIAQAITEPAALFTNDRGLQRYSDVVTLI